MVFQCFPHTIYVCLTKNPPRYFSSTPRYTFFQVCLEAVFFNSQKHSHHKTEWIKKFWVIIWKYQKISEEISFLKSTLFCFVEGTDIPYWLKQMESWQKYKMIRFGHCTTGYARLWFPIEDKPNNINNMISLDYHLEAVPKNQTESRHPNRVSQ